MTAARTVKNCVTRGRATPVLTLAARGWASIQLVAFTARNFLPGCSARPLLNTTMDDAIQLCCNAAVRPTDNGRSWSLCATDREDCYARRHVLYGAWLSSRLPVYAWLR